jgi:hypothetical protein
MYEYEYINKDMKHIDLLLPTWQGRLSQKRAPAAVLTCFQLTFSKVKGTRRSQEFREKARLPHLPLSHLCV